MSSVALGGTIGPSFVQNTPLMLVLKVPLILVM